MRKHVKRQGAYVASVLPLLCWRYSDFPAGASEVSD
jgi:hypothetical protein